MAHPIKMPKVAMAMNEGTVTEWLLSEGDKVARNQEIFSIETEKTAYEVEATHEGWLHIIVPKGGTVPVEDIVGYIAESEAELAELQSGGAAPAFAAIPAEKTPAEPAPTAAPATTPVPAAAAGGRIKASPLAKRMAANDGINLGEVTGTGPGGRIKKRDILAYQASAPAAPQAAASADTGPVEAYGRSEKARIPLTGMRGAIADAMAKANSETAHTHIFGEIDITETLAMRKRFVAKAEKLGTKVSMNAFFMKAMAVAAKQVPIANATLENGEVIIWENINIGMAVALEGGTEYDSGLIVPVVKDVQSKGLVEIDKEIRRLTAAARDGTLAPDDTKGGTITLSSTAGFWPGWATSTALINVPQVVIVQPASAVQKPGVVDGEIVIRDMMPISLTMDHRAMDGAPYARFYSIFHECLADPDTMLA